MGTDPSGEVLPLLIAGASFAFKAYAAYETGSNILGLVHAIREGAAIRGLLIGMIADAAIGFAGGKMLDVGISAFGKVAAKFGKRIDWSLTPKKTGESRFDHVQKHGSNVTGKNVHSVFDGDPVLTTMEAWYRAQHLGIQPNKLKSGVLELIVPMGRKVGWQGGGRGTGAALDQIRILLKPDGETIITAMPY